MRQFADRTHRAKLASRTVMLAACLSALLASVTSNAQEAAASAALPPQQKSVQTITPIFGQLVGFTLPAGFNPADFEKTQGDNYIRESVLKGETVDHWTQMITVTGIKGLGSNPDANPRVLAETIAGGFHRACPDTFAVNPFGDAKVAGFSGFVAVIRCGSISDGASTHSETAIVMTLKGTSDYYTMQWAERGPVATDELASENSKWLDRLRQLSPIRLCPIVPGERAPYPSCLQAH
ncbi:hypothetical protein FAZ95_24470 [Trinickia violacea]|uniref:Uncharacterized protein n=1 Tax=Trinickia violacea TaxID=2571746 RepID=A0A4P8IVR2_9BURK|nr:hypothetical protein [Trinickia violacea]QCP52337.1 hypothetical protein FAZ95_24470 [Trinickia violacea]